MMKKNVLSASVLVILLLFSFSSCAKQTSFESEIADLSTADVLADNISALNDDSSKICLYGENILALVDNKDGTSSVVCDDEVIYKHDSAVRSIKAVDNRHICLHSDSDIDSYLLLDLQNGEAERVKFSVTHKDKIIGAEPFFTKNAVYIVAAIAIEGQYTPSIAIYCKTSQSNEFSVVIDYSMFWQILPNGVLFSNDGETVTFVDTEFKKTEYGGFALEEVFSIICGNYQLSVAKSNFSYRITDVFSGKTVSASKNIADEYDLPRNSYIENDNLYFVNSKGIQRVDFDTDTCTVLTEDSPYSFMISNGKLYYLKNNAVKRIDL